MSWTALRLAPTRRTATRPARLRGLTMFRLVSIVFLLAAALASWSPGVRATPGAGPAVQGRPTVTDTQLRLNIAVANCPDVMAAAPEPEQIEGYGVDCTSTDGLYGIPIGASLDGGSSSFQYTNPDNAGRLSWEFRDLPFQSRHLLTATDVAGSPLRSPVVWCIRTDTGGFTDEYSPITVTGGTATYEYADTGTVLDCLWYRFPGGIADPNVAPELRGGVGALTIRSWICSEDDASPDPSALASGFTGDFTPPRSGDPLVDSQTLADRCSPSDVSLAFDMFGIGENFVYFSTDGGEDASEGTASYSFEEIVPDFYEISSFPPPEWDTPRLFCESQIASVADAPDGVSEYVPEENRDIPTFLVPVAAQATVICDWFNIELPDGVPGPYIPLNQPSPGSASLAVAVFGCPEDMDFEAAARGGECLEPVDGHTVRVQGPDDYQEQGDTGDSQPGEVLFDDLDAGTYFIQTPGSVSDEAVVYCDGVETRFEFAEARVRVYADNDVRCEWFIPAADESSPSPSASASADATADRDGDGLRDAEEVPDVYGTEPDNADTDGDGVEDGDEIDRQLNPLDSDSDMDGLSDGQEIDTYTTDPLTADSDGDGFDDGPEVDAGSDPNDFDDTPGS